MTADRNTRIRERAYHLWLEEGRPHGRHDEHWRCAERELAEQERSLQEIAETATPRDAGEAAGAPAAPIEQTVPARAASRSGGKRSSTVPVKTKPRATRSRPAASGPRSRDGSHPVTQ